MFQKSFQRRFPKSSNAQRFCGKKKLLENVSRPGWRRPGAQEPLPGLAFQSPAWWIRGIFWTKSLEPFGKSFSLEKLRCWCRDTLGFLVRSQFLATNLVLPTFLLETFLWKDFSSNTIFQRLPQKKKFQRKVSKRTTPRRLEVTLVLPGLTGGILWAPSGRSEAGKKFPKKSFQILFPKYCVSIVLKCIIKPRKNGAIQSWSL